MSFSNGSTPTMRPSRTFAQNAPQWEAVRTRRSFMASSFGTSFNRSCGEMAKSQAALRCAIISESDHARYEDRPPMTRYRVSTSAGAALALVIAATSAAHAQSVADFYRGKTINYILAVPDGASWGLYARTFTEHLRKHIPGNPTVIMQVMPGGGGVTAGNYIY